ncbi:hypothetical protein Tco_1582032, partial [Tanacetum coccineum]
MVTATIVLTARNRQFSRRNPLVVQSELWRTRLILMWNGASVSDDGASTLSTVALTVTTVPLTVTTVPLLATAVTGMVTATIVLTARNRQFSRRNPL